MRRRAYEPAPVRERSGWAGCLLGSSAVAGGVALYLWAGRSVVLGGGVAAGGAAVVVAVASAGRRGGEAGSHRGAPAVVLALAAAGGVAVAAVTHPVLTGLVGGLAGLLILWGLIRRYRGHERNEAVKPAPPVGSPEEAAERWGEFRRRAGLHHPVDADRMVELIGEPRSNGVGGLVLRVGLRDAELLPEDLDDAAVKIRRQLRVDHVFTRPVDTDTADLHLYRGVPLGERVDWRWLADHPAPSGERVTIGATVTAQAATVRRRLSIGWFGLTDTGKTSGQLALVHSLTAVQRIPVHLLVLDNRAPDGQRGSELRVLSGLPAVCYRNRSVDAWELILRALDIMGERQSAKGLIGDMQPSDDRPHVRLMVTELLGVLRSRPPAEVDDWASYTRGRLDARPKVGDWREMLAEGLAEIVRTGRDVETALDFGAQAGQIDEIPGVLRRMLPQRVLFRVGNDSDISPVLGDAAGVDAHLIPDWQQGACYVKNTDGRAVFARVAHIPPAELAEAVVEPLREHGRRLLYVVGGTA